MPFSLTPETQRLLEERVESGQFTTADEVVYAALEALDELNAAEIDDEMLDAFDCAEDQIERGEGYDLEEVRAHIRAKLSGE